MAKQPKTLVLVFFFWHPFKKDYAQVKLDHFPNDGG